MQGRKAFAVIGFQLNETRRTWRPRVPTRRQRTMAKNEEPRPRSKRTNKEKNVVADEVPQVEESTKTVESAEIVPEPEAGDPEGNEILELPVLPLRGTVVFPLTVVPLAAAQPRSLRLIDE